MLSYSGNLASEEITSADFNMLCENLMSHVLRHSSVKFAESSAELGSHSYAVLDEIVEIATDCPSMSIIVTGHTDNTGNEHFNRGLSQARADSVVDYLTGRGIQRARLTARGAGSDTPIANNDSPRGRKINRRIEFELSFP